MEMRAILSNMRRTAELGTDFWNDSCDLHELADAVREGAVGATSNPVIVYQAFQNDRDTWVPVLDAIIADHPTATEDEITWTLIAQMARQAAALLEPVYNQTGARKGFLSVQVNPKFHSSSWRMVEHARELARIAPNIAIKIPATAAGITAMEELTAEGIRINATVCFSVVQAIASAEAVERGVARAGSQGRDTQTLLPTVTIMVGRIDDHLRRVMESQEVTVDPGHLNWAGIAIFKKAHTLFRDRGYRSTLLSAAYRYHMQWTDLIGENVIQTMPYKWWKQFNESIFTPETSIHQAISAQTQEALYNHFEDYRKAYDDNGMFPEDFDTYGATLHTLKQFLGGYQKLVELVRERMLREPAQGLGSSAQ